MDPYDVNHSNDHKKTTKKPIVVLLATCPSFTLRIIMGGAVSHSRNNEQLAIDDGVQRTRRQCRRVRKGDRIPSIALKGRIRVGTGEEISNFAWKDVTTEDLFKGKRIVLFSLPGAFTPVCSCDHLPGFTANYNKVLNYGVDDIYCISVNDAFVMRQLGIMQGLSEEKDVEASHSFPLNPGNFKQVKLIPDGAARFTRAMGMSCRFENIAGYGERSWRYSAVINDMVVEQLFIEDEGNVRDDSTSDPLQVSDVQTMLTYLEATAQTHVQQHVPAANTHITNGNDSDGKLSNTSQEKTIVSSESSALSYASHSPA